jgi:hypothetical protein
MKGKPRVSSLGATTPPICATQNAGPNHSKERRELEGFFLFFRKSTDRVGRERSLRLQIFGFENE